MGVNSVDFKFVNQDEREALYDEIWTDPVITVAKRYGISDNGLRKHCKRLGIPLPPSGYWAKINSGQKVPKPALPKVTGELRKHIRNYALKVRTDVNQMSDDELNIDEEFHLFREETKVLIKEICSNIQVRGQLRAPHHLIEDHKEEVIYRRKRDKVLSRSNISPSYYSSVKSKYRDNKPIVPIYVSETNVNRVYRILDAMIRALDEMEGHVHVSIEAGKDKAYFSIMHSVFYFEFKEEPIKKSKSSGIADSQNNIVLSMSAKSWFTDSGQSNMTYKDHDNEPLENQVGAVIYEMFILVNKHLAIDEIKDREQKREWAEQERKWRLEKMRKGQLEEMKLLEQAVMDWDKAEKIRSFADRLEKEINNVEDLEKKNRLIAWLDWARSKADWIDPLTEKEDDLLGKSKHIFELIDESF